MALQAVPSLYLPCTFPVPSLYLQLGRGALGRSMGLCRLWCGDAGAGRPEGKGVRRVSAGSHGWARSPRARGTRCRGIERERIKIAILSASASALSVERGGAGGRRRRGRAHPQPSRLSAASPCSRPLGQPRHTRTASGCLVWNSSTRLRAASFSPGASRASVVGLSGLDGRTSVW